MKPEGRFKQRTHTSAKRVAKLANLELDYGLKAGDTDQIYKFGTVWIGFEHKRKGQGPRKLQEVRMAELAKHGLPCVHQSADDDKFDQEKLAFYRLLKEQVEPEKVGEYVAQYASDAALLHGALTELLEKAGE